MTEISQKLRAAREHAGLSQGQVAKMLDMHRPTISEIEAGRRRVSAQELTTFAEIYEVSVAWLAGTAKEDDGLNDRVKLAARALTNLKPEDLDKVLRLLTSLRDVEES